MQIGDVCDMNCINWDLYKGDTGNNKKAVKAQNSFINFCNTINEFDFKLLTYYHKTDEKVEISYSKAENIILTATPNKLQRKFELFKDFLKDCEINGDIFIKISELNSRNKFIAEIKTIDNEIVKIDTSRYVMFNNSRKCAYEHYKNNSYTPLSGYKGDKCNQDLMCPNGHKISITPQHFKRGDRCKKCLKCCKDEAKKEFIEIAEKEGYKVVGEYFSAREKVEVLCPNGHTFSTLPTNFKSHNVRCGKCSLRDLEEARKQFENVVKEASYVLLSNYKTSNEKVELLCPKGHIFKTTPKSFKNNKTRCPQCKHSKGEKRIEKWLKDNDVLFTPQKTYPNLKHTSLLKYDFFLNEHNLLIEYDGEQHFEPRDFAGKGLDWAMNEFKQTQIRDNLKNDFAKSNNINLLRIPYTEFNNIEDVLDKHVNQIKSKKNKG